MKTKLLVGIMALLGILFIVNPTQVKADTENTWLDQSKLDNADWTYDNKVDKQVLYPNYGFASTKIKKNGKLYVQFGMIQFSPNDGSNVDGYIYYEIRKDSNTGKLLTSGSVLRKTVVSNNLNFGVGYDYVLIRTSGNVKAKPFKFYSSIVEMSGATPTTPSGSASHSSGKEYNIKVSAQANMTDTIWYALTYNGQKFEAMNQGTTAGVFDDVTSYEYIINTSSSAPSATYIDNNGKSSSSGSFSYTISDTSTQYYIHIVAKSYTGKLSGVRTIALTPSVYKITLDPNGGTLADSISDNNVTNAFYERYGRWIGYSSASGYKSWTVGSNGETYLPFYATRTGYIFEGFYTAKSGGTLVISNNYAKVSNTYFTANTTVYARWKAWTHTVKYDANGGVGAPSSQTKTYGSSLTLSSTKPTRTGYTFINWTASIGGTYSPGVKYTHDQNGGTVTLKANWDDETAPECKLFSATPNEWSSGNGIISFIVKDQGSGLDSVKLERYSDVTKEWSTVKTWNYSGSTVEQSGTYTETNEGVFYYRLTIKDKSGNTTTKISSSIYLDHSIPVIIGIENTVTDWTNIAPSINVSATDYLEGTAYTGSGLLSIEIKDDAGNIVASGTSSASYTLLAKYEGIHTWYIAVTDNVGHTNSAEISTKYDITKPGMDGTEITYVENGITITGYCQDNVIKQSIDDKANRSPNNPNSTSGLKSVIMYKVKDGVKTAIYSDTTKTSFPVSDTNSSFQLLYDANLVSDSVDYYLVVAQDYAGNTTTKKLVIQRVILKDFHTSIDRSSYNK